MRLEYWTPEQIEFLKKNYKTCGDKELAEIFQTKWPKQKGWTLKHIEKKRKYLNIKRTPAQLFKIKQKAKAKGVYVLGLQKTWMKRGAAPEGAVVIWATESQWPTKHIKINGKFINYHRWLWQQAGRSIPKGKNICPKQGISEVKTADDLECITKAEHARRTQLKSCKALSNNYVAAILSHGDPDMRQYLKANPEILQLKRNQLLMNRTINSKLKTINNGTRKSN